MLDLYNLPKNSLARYAKLVHNFKDWLKDQAAPLKIS